MGCTDYYLDDDRDTYGHLTESRCYCEVNGSYDIQLPLNTDCDDSDPTINPGATELADGIDQNCDGTADEGTDLYDNDGDGYCADDTTCTDPTVLPGDCDDTDDEVNPNADEICGDGVDNDWQRHPERSERHRLQRLLPRRRRRQLRPRDGVSAATARPAGTTRS